MRQNSCRTPRAAVPLEKGQGKQMVTAHSGAWGATERRACRYSWGRSDVRQNRSFGLRGPRGPAARGWIQIKERSGTRSIVACRYSWGRSDVRQNSCRARRTTVPLENGYISNEKKFTERDVPQRALACRYSWGRSDVRQNSPCAPDYRPSREGLHQ